MKIKHLVVLASLLFLLSGLVWSQAEQKPYSYKFDEGIGECIFTDVSVDQVWFAAIKAFITEGLKGKATWQGAPINPNRPSNHMTGTWILGRGLMGRVASVNVFFEQKTGEVEVYCTAGGKDVSEKHQVEIGKAFFEKVAELLYKPTDSEKEGEGEE